MKNISMTMMAAALMFGVAAGCQQKEEEERKVIQPVQIAQGNLYGSGRENIPKQDIVISASAEWASLLEVMNLYSYNRVVEETEVDFTQHIVIAIFEEVKSNGGWSIDITDVSEYADKIVVTGRSPPCLSNLKTGDLTSVTTQPFHIAKIPVTKKQLSSNIFNYTEK